MRKTFSNYKAIVNILDFIHGVVLREETFILAYLKKGSSNYALEFFKTIEKMSSV